RPHPLCALPDPKFPHHSRRHPYFKPCFSILFDRRPSPQPRILSPKIVARAFLTGSKTKSLTRQQLRLQTHQTRRAQYSQNRDHELARILTESPTDCAALPASPASPPRDSTP